MTKKYLFWAMLILLGLFSGWWLSNYSQNQLNRAESLLLLGEANEALRKGDVDVAADAALRAVTLNQESFLAMLMVAELYDKRGSDHMAIRYYQKALTLSKKESKSATNVDRSIQERLELLTKKVAPSVNVP